MNERSLPLEAPTIPRPRPIDTAGILPGRFLRRLYRPVQPLVEAGFAFPALWRLYDESARRGVAGPDFARELLTRLGVTWSMPPDDLAALRRRTGPLLVVSNHPFGGLDSLMMVLALEAIRPGGWCLFSNEVICSIPEFGTRLIPVDSLGSSAASQRLNHRGLARGLRHLREGGVLGAFPAGRVSHFDRSLGGVCDRPWSDHLARLAEKTGAALACLHIPGANSRRLLRVPKDWFRLRALMLCRELVRPPVSRLEARLAAWYEPSAIRRLAATPAPGAQLRARCFLRQDRDVPPPLREQSPGVRPPLAPPVPRDALEAEVASLGDAARLLASPDGEIEVLLFQGSEAPALLRELGRCRELTFRAAGQGVGLACDVAPEDDYYHHLVLWHRERGEILGAYRLGFIREILATRGPRGLYLDHVFKMRRGFYARLGPAIELSRSFVMPSCQRDNRALALLWRGLGAAAARARCTVFFGSVTISNTHHPASRAILVEHLRRNYAEDGAMRRLVRARRPFQPATTYHPLVGEAFAGLPLDALAPLVEQLEDGQRGIPPLLRYYCSLGARFLAFHVEASFQDALYCLLRVDLNAIPEGYRRRFLGSEPTPYNPN